MRTRWVSLAVVIVLLATLAGSALAQEAAPTSPAVAAPTGITITWPTPVSEVNGVIDIVGTVNEPDLVAYVLEAVALDEQMQVPENAAWLPMAAAQRQPVISGVLGTVDTTFLPDGLYAMRVAATVSNTTTATASTYEYTVSPVRVSNISSPLSPSSSETPAVEPEGTPAPTPTPAAPSAPYVITAPGNGAVNVRRCDQVDNNACPVEGGLAPGVQATVNGLSSDGSGWYLITTPAGLQGWVSPTVVNAIGDLSSVPSVAPPAPLPPPPPPSNGGPVAPTGLSISTGSIVCLQPFTINAVMTNQGNAESAPGTVTIQDVRVADGQVTWTGYGSFPSLDPGQTYNAQVNATITTFVNELHELRAFNDGLTNSFQYILQPGSCPGGSPAPPPPPPSDKSKRFGEGECRVTPKSGASMYDQPHGNRIGKFDGSRVDVYEAKRINGKVWYEVFVPTGTGAPAPVWVKEQDVSSIKNACRF